MTKSAKKKTQSLKGCALPTISQILKAYDSMGNSDFYQWLEQNNCKFIADGLTANVFSFGDYVIKVIRLAAVQKARLLGKTPKLDQIDPNSMIGCIYVQPILFSLDGCLCIQRKVKLPPQHLREFGNDTLPLEIYKLFKDYVESSFQGFTSMFDIHNQNLGYLGDRLVMFDGHEKEVANFYWQPTTKTIHY